MSRTLIAGALLSAAAFALGSLAPAVCSAQTNTSIHVSVHPNRPGALATLNVAIRYEDPQSAVPAPIRRATLSLPEGLGIEIPRLRSCSPRQLHEKGPRVCPRASLLGTGSAVAIAREGSQTLTENVTLTTVLGPLVGMQPTFDVFAQGYTPFGQRVVLKGTVLPGNPPYGEELVVTIPPIATLPLEPDASIAALSLSIGPSPGSHARGANQVTLPSHCPTGGLPFAIHSSFADASESSASTELPCP